MSRMTRRSILPVNQVVPLTYRDGISLLEMIEELSRYIKDQLHPSLQSVVDDIAAETERQLDESHDRFVDGVQEFQQIHDRFMSDVNASLIALNDTAVSDLVEDDTSLLGQVLNRIFATKDELGHIDTKRVYTVGERGDYQTINEALYDLSKMKPLYNSGGIDVELRLLAGFVMEEQVIVEKYDFGWVKITAENDIVPIRRSAITSLHDRTGRAAFTARNHGTLPYISCLFEFDTSGDDLGQHGCVVYFGSNVTFDFHAGITHAPGRGINVQQNSHATLFRANFSYAGDGGIRVANGSGVAAEEATATHCGNFGLSLSSGSTAMANRATFTDNEWGIAAANGSSLSASGVDVSHCNIGVYSRQGSKTDFSFGIANDCNIGLYSREAGLITANSVKVERAKQTAIYVLSGSTVNASLASGHDSRDFIYCSESIVTAEDSQANDCLRNAVTAADNGMVSVNGVISRGAGQRGIYVTNNGHVNARHGDFSQAGGNGIRALQGSHVLISNGNVRMGDQDVSADIVCMSGSTVVAHNTQGGNGNPENQIGSHGVVFR